MGLFDNFQFNPQIFAGGGLLERLGMTAPLNMPGQGFQDQPTSAYAHGGVQVPVFGQPDPAAIPPAAQPAQYQAQPQGTGGNSFMAGLQGFGEGGKAGGLIGALTGGIGGFSRGETRENQTIRALTNAGMSKDLAATVAADPGLLRAVMPQLMGTGGQTDDIKEYTFAKSQGFKGTLEEWMQRKRAGAGEYSLTPVYGTNEKGETVLLQPGKSGAAIQTQLPPGVKISSGVEKMDAGTHWILIDKRTGNVVGQQPKDLRGAESEKVIGETQGKAVAAAPADIQTGQNALDLLEKVEKHPHLERGTGASSLFNYVPGTGGYDFSNIVEQAKSGAFLSAIQQMRGMGSLSNAEGQTATAAVNRMDVATSKEAFLDAVKDYRAIIKQGLERAKSKLAGGVAAPPDDGWQTVAPGVRIREKK